VYFVCLSCYYFYIVLSLYLYCCYVVYPDHHFIVIYLETCVLCVCLVITSTLFYQSDDLDTQHSNSTSIKIKQCRSNNKTNTEYTSLKVYYSKVCVSKSSLYCNIPSDLCTLCLSCYYFYIVLSLHLYCRYVVYLNHHFTVVHLSLIEIRIN
jgi:hypothetical protein